VDRRENAGINVECEWVDTRVMRGTHVWVNFAPPDGLDATLNINDLPAVKVYSTIYTDTRSTVEHKEL
jgi:hypothetical protein